MTAKTKHLRDATKMVGNRSFPGWALVSMDGSLLYSGNAAPEYEDMRLGDFVFNGVVGACPVTKATKREAMEVARKWNGLAHRCLKGHVGRDGKPLPCIGPEAKVRPVKVRIGIEFA